jgi:hypothetical protein
MKSYANDLALLTTLTTHLGMCQLKSKSAPKLADDLSLNPKDIERIFTDYPELFIKAGSSATHTGESTYTLHIRYALRWKDKNDQGEDARKPIEPEHLSALLSYIDNQAAQENALSRQLVANRISIGAAIVAAIAAIIAAIISSQSA